MLDEETMASWRPTLQTNLAAALLIELFGSWRQAQEDEPRGRQLVETLLALGVHPPDTADQSDKDERPLAGRSAVPESLQGVSSVMSLFNAGQAAQERRGHGDAGHEGSG